MSLDLESMLARYQTNRAKEKAKVEETHKKVHQQNLRDAEAAGVSLEEWHRQKSEIGQGVTTQTETNVQENPSIINSADYVLSYLFPRKITKRK